jgi:hypothetical protein
MTKNKSPDAFLFLDDFQQHIWMRAFLPQKQREIRLNSKRDSAAKSAFAAL